MSAIADRPRLHVIPGGDNAPRTHICTACGTADAWAPGWRWYGPLDGPPEHKLCPACPDDVISPVDESAGA